MSSGREYRRLLVRIAQTSLKRKFRKDRFLIVMDRAIIGSLAVVLILSLLVFLVVVASGQVVSLP